jgi:hypothetical protein
LTKKYGMGGEFKSAKMAPKEIQDAIAKRYVEDILKQAGGDVSKVPLAWYTGNIQGNLNGAKIAPGHPTPEAYQSNWMKDYAGPSNGYKSANIANPASTLPPSYDSDRARAAAQNDRSEDILASYSSRLEEQIRLQREANDIARSTNRAVK